jgi:rhamnosyltransferase subunit A
MPIEKQIVSLPMGLKVYVEHHVFDPTFETVILVNGALATTASFGQTIRYLGERLNAICFDLPYAGQSRQHNICDFLLTKDDEVAILLDLAERFRPSYLISVSWGGVASLFALTRGCSSIRRQGRPARARRGLDRPGRSGRASAAGWLVDAGDG